MSKYTLEFYHTIIRRPMLNFRKNIMSQVVKRQDQEKIMNELNVLIEQKEEEYQIELNYTYVQEETPEQELRKNLGSEIQTISERAEDWYDTVHEATQYY